MGSKRALLAALLLSGCSGSLIDHLGIDLGQGQGQLPDGGCIENAQACGTACQACPHQDGKLAACTQDQCTYTDAPVVCTAPALACDSASGCCTPTQISAGGDTTCAIYDGDTVYCWGEQPGTNGTSSAFPAKVQGLAAVTSIAVGPSHACAIVSGQVRCWGSNDSGQLGQATPASSATPLVAVAGLSGVTSVAVGDKHSCALTASGVFCWGANGSGQLGDPTAGTPSGPTPVAVSGTTSATSLSSGLLDNCVTIGDSVSCWGGDLHGQLGNAKTGAAFALSPVTFKGGNTSNPVLGSGEAHNCATVNSALQCWGAGTSGQLGTNTAADSPAPGKVGLFAPGLFTAGGSHTCAVTAGGGGVSGDDDPSLSAGLYCWGSNANGQLGSGATSSTTVRQPAGNAVSLGHSVAALAAGSSHTCALLDQGFLSCWGANDKGQVGTGAVSGSVPSPGQVTSLAQ
jgi:alpha-tubulin suppressor-like RCC1 family protein